MARLPPGGMPYATANKGKTYARVMEPAAGPLGAVVHKINNKGDGDVERAWTNTARRDSRVSTSRGEMVRD